MQPFSILIGLGALFGLLLVVWRAPEKESSRYLDAALLILLGALVGSRVMTVVVNFNYYQNHPGEIIQVWLGGLSGIGAMAGGIIMVIVMALWWKLPAGKLADVLLPLAGALAITAWLGCWVDSCAYGYTADQWWALPGRDEWGMSANRVPVQLLGAILTLILVWSLDWAGKRLPIPGLMAAIGLFGLSAVLFALSFLRADPTPMWNNLRLEAWGAIGLMIFSLCLMGVIIFRWKFQKKKETSPGRQLE
jgi:phosphatidylglycerol:prolipoprotein diacylglycerol transferase